MAGKTNGGASEKAQRPTWRTPKVEEVGKLADIVRSGHANGKSGASIDGSSSGNDETMN
jgi:hypothetical protein